MLLFVLLVAAVPEPDLSSFFPKPKTDDEPPRELAEKVGAARLTRSGG